MGRRCRNETRLKIMQDFHCDKEQLWNSCLGFICIWREHLNIPQSTGCLLWKWIFYRGFTLKMNILQGVYFKNDYSTRCLLWKWIFYRVFTLKMNILQGVYFKNDYSTGCLLWKWIFYRVFTLKLNILLGAILKRMIKKEVFLWRMIRQDVFLKINLLKNYDSTGCFLEKDN